MSQHQNNSTYKIAFVCLCIFLGWSLPTLSYDESAAERAIEQSPNENDEAYWERITELLTRHFVASLPGFSEGERHRMACGVVERLRYELPLSFWIARDNGRLMYVLFLPAEDEDIEE